MVSIEVENKVDVATSHERKVVRAPEHLSDPAQTLSEMGFVASTYDGVIVISGGAAAMQEGSDLNSKIKTVLESLFPGKAVFHGGTDSGIMAIANGAITTLRESSAGITVGSFGVSPEIHVEPHFGPTEDGKYHLGDQVDGELLVQSDVTGEWGNWGNETGAMYQVIDGATKNLPSVAIVCNGGGITLNGVFANMDQGRPMIILEGSGRAADEIARIINSDDSQPVDAKLHDKFSQKYNSGEKKGLFTVVDVKSMTEQDIATVIQAKLAEQKNTQADSVQFTRQ